MAEAVLRGRREERGKLDGPVDDVSGTAGAGFAPVTEQQGLQVGGGRPEECRAFLDDVRHDVLVREDDPFGRRRQEEAADDAALEELALALLVDVQGGLVVLGEDARGQPVRERVGGATVGALAGVALRKDQPDDVVGVGRLQVEETVRADHDVVRG